MTMHVKVEINPAAAVRARRTSAGVCDVAVTEALMEALTDEELAVLGEVVTSGEAIGDDETVEGTAAEVRRLIVAIVARRAEAAEGERRAAQAWLDLDDDAFRRLVVRVSEYSYSAGTLQSYADGAPAAARIDALPGLRARCNALRTQLAVESREEEEAFEAARRAECDTAVAAWTAAPQEVIREAVARRSSTISRDDYLVGSGLPTVCPDWDDTGHLLTILQREQEAVRAEVAAEEERREREQAEAIDAWVAEYGDESVRARHAEGLLPRAELLAAVRDQVFVDLSELPRYVRLRADDVAHDNDCPYDADLTFEASEVEALSAETYAALLVVRERAPEGATVTPRVHVGSCDACSGRIERYSALVSLDWYGIRLSREYTLASPSDADES